MDGDAIRNSTISASSSVQTWEYSKSHQNFLVMNLSPESTTASDTAILIDTEASITTASTTAVWLLAGKSFELHYLSPVSTLYAYSTGQVHYGIVPY